MKKKIGKDLLDAKPPQQLFPSLGFFTFGAQQQIHTVERNSLAAS